MIKHFVHRAEARAPMNHILVSGVLKYHDEYYDRIRAKSRARRLEKELAGNWFDGPAYSTQWRPRSSPCNWNAPGNNSQSEQSMKLPETLDERRVSAAITVQSDSPL